MNRAAILLVLALGGCATPPMNDDEFMDMCMSRGTGGGSAIFADEGILKWCQQKVDTYHRNSKAIGRTPYNGDRTPLNFMFW